MFVYIAEDKYTSIDEAIEINLRAIECEKNCTIFDTLRNDNIHDEGHVIRYLKSQCDINNLIWVVFYLVGLCWNVLTK